MIRKELDVPTRKEFATHLADYAKRTDGIVTPKMFGAVGDGETDDTEAIQAALDDVTSNQVRFGSYTYKITLGLIIPHNKIVDFETCTIIAYFTDGNILTTRDPVSAGIDKPRFYVLGSGATISGESNLIDNPNLNGLWVNTCNFSKFSNLTFQALKGHPIVLGPTGNRDIINIVIDKIATNTGKGLKIMAGLVDGVDYKNTTDGRIRDCHWTNGTAAVSKAVEVICNKHADLSNASVFGLTFDRNAFNPVHADGGTFVDMRSEDPGSIYGITFNNCEGEFGYTGTTPTYNSIYLQGVDRCKFDIQGQQAESNGIKLINSNYNIFSSIFDNFATTNTGKILDVDVTSHGNIFNNIANNALISTENDYTTAPEAQIFASRIIDLGYNNKAYGAVSTDIARVFKKDYMTLIDSTGKFINPLFVNVGTTCVASYNPTTDIFSAKFKAGDDSQFQFKYPSVIAANEYICFRLKYRFVQTSFGAAIFKITTSVDGTARSPRLKVSTDWVDQVFITKKTGTINSLIADGILDSDVDIEFQILDIYKGAIPYPANYNPNDIYVDAFHQNPYCTTIKRPVYVTIGYRIFDTTLNKLITWNGTVWKDASGVDV